MPKPSERGSVRAKLLYIILVSMFGWCLPWAVAAIVRTAKGTCTLSKATSCTVASVTVSAGDALIVVSGTDAAFSSATYGATTLTTDCNTGGVQFTTISSTPNLSAQTATVTVNISKGSGGAAVIDVSGLVTSSILDKTTSKTGSGTAADSGATTTTAQAVEFWQGSIGGSADITAGTWGNSFSAGQTALGNGNGFIEGFRIVSSTGTADAAATIASANWGACVATYKGSGGAPPPTPRQLLTTGVGFSLWPALWKGSLPYLSPIY